MRFIRAFILFPILLVGGYYFWSQANRQAPEIGFDTKIIEIKEIGKNSGKGNVVGIQPYMFPVDYASEMNFYLKLNEYFQAAQRNKYFDSATVVLLPEYIGTWLVAAGEKRSVYYQNKIEDAMSVLVISNFWTYWNIEVPETVADKTTYSLFTMKAAEMAKIYHKVFSALAKKYAVTIIAGSIVLPEPYISNDTLKVNTQGLLYNVSLVYQPDGKPYPQIIKKCYPINEELPFISRGTVNEIPVFDLPIGRTGVLICADSWYPEAYQSLQNKQVGFVAVPSYINTNEAMSAKWKGYNGAPNPSDVDSKDIENISEGEAWLKYALPGRIQASGAKNGMNVFLRGKLWDLGSEGFPMLIKDSTFEKGNLADGASLICLWL